MIDIRRREQQLAATLLLLAATALPGCAREPGAGFHATDISGADYARDWSMPDADGRTRTLSDFRGKVVYVFFGFARCPMVCPATMADMAKVKKALGPDGDRLQVVFVTVDPEHDTPALMRGYLDAFDTSAVALVGDAAQLAAIAAEFKVFYQKIPAPQGGGYFMEHSSGGYLYDRHGRLRLYAQYGMPTDRLIADIGKLVREP